MDFKDNRNLAIGILLSLLSVLLTSAMFLAYKVVMAEGINGDLNRENTLLYKDKQELLEKLKQKEKQTAE